MFIALGLGLFVALPLLILVGSLGKTAVGTPSQKAQKLANEDNFGSARLEAAKTRRERAATATPSRTVIMAGRPVIPTPQATAVSRPIGAAAEIEADVLQFPVRPAAAARPAQAYQHAGA